jgi:hypothetical protein
MITINTISPTRFSFNGVTYHKNFMPFVTGNKIAIINVYDGCITLTDAPTIFSDFTVNGVTYSSVNDLQSALLDVIYTRNSLTNAAITLTTTGNSGAATLTGITLNIPNYIGGTGTTNYLPKFTGGSTLGNSLIFDNGTNVGIGTTTPSVFALVDANGQFRVSNLSVQGFYQARTSDTVSQGVFGGNSFVLRNGATSEDLNFDIFNRSTSAWYTPMVIKNTGNVGIGTTSPSSRLDVNGQGLFSHDNTPIRLNSIGTTFTQLDFLNNGVQKSAIWWNNSNNTFNIFTGVVALTATSSGNVGIGTTSPAQRLDVNGLINSTNGICVGGEGVSRFWTGTQAAYDAITTKVSTNVYLIT